MTLRPATEEDVPAVHAIEAQVFGVGAWSEPSVREELTGPRRRAVLACDPDVVGYVAVIPLHGWSRHVGDVRIVVDPDHRGRGVGQALARHAVLEALELGVAKLVVEVIADQEALIAMFVALGFEPEALLIDHVRDRSGELRDLLVLAHTVAEQWASMAAAGIVENR